jgi:MGT family glycosyltransferase
VARFLFVVPPLVGHINPTIAVAGELEARRHEVAWVGHRSVAAPLLPAGARLYALDGPHDGAAVSAVGERALELRGFPALKSLWEDVLVPLARATIPGVEGAVLDWAPDVIGVDRQTLAGAIVARRSGLPWATMATTSLDHRASLGGLHRIHEWIEARLAELQRASGLEPVPMVEESPHLVLVFSTLELVGGVNPAPGVYHFVGPSIGGRGHSAPAEFPWERLRADVPRVLASLGSISPKRGERFFGALAEGLGDRALQVILVAPEGFGPFPDNFLVRPWVPQLELLSRVDAVVCHAGHNTVCESLAHGLPLVVLPIRDDQPVVAAQVTRAGVGLRLPFARPRPAALREAVLRVLNEPAFRAAAQRIRLSFDAAGGPRRAAELLAGLERSTLAT